MENDFAFLPIVYKKSNLKDICYSPIPKYAGNLTLEFQFEEKTLCFYADFVKFLLYLFKREFNDQYNKVNVAFILEKIEIFEQKYNVIPRNNIIPESILIKFNNLIDSMKSVSVYNYSQRYEQYRDDSFKLLRKIVKKNIYCSICRTILKNPIVLKPCNHIFCNDCMDTRHTKCYFCGKNCLKKIIILQLEGNKISQIKSYENYKQELDEYLFEIQQYREFFDYRDMLFNNFKDNLKNI